MATRDAPASQNPPSLRKTFGITASDSDGDVLRMGTVQVLQVPYDTRYFPGSCEWLYEEDGYPRYGCDLTDGGLRLNGGWPRDGYFRHPDISGTCSMPGDENRASTTSMTYPDMAIMPAFAEHSVFVPPPDDKWLSMLVVLLPPGQDGMRALEEHLSAELFEEWRDQLRYAKVDVTLPKFKSGGQYDLVPILEGLGVKKVGEAGSLSGISRNLHVSEAVHHAYVQVGGEHGTTPISRPDQEAEVPTQEHPYPFVADRPFLYFIQETQSGAILFMGKIVDPTK